MSILPTCGRATATNAEPRARIAKVAARARARLTQSSRAARAPAATVVSRRAKLRLKVRSGAKDHVVETMARAARAKGRAPEIARGEASPRIARQQH